MTRAKLYGLLIYSKTIKELEDNWEKCLQHSDIISDFQYHREYYDLAKDRISKGIKINKRVLKGGMKNNIILSKQIGNTIKPQDEYYGKLYLEDNMLYYYDMNFHNVLTDKIPIVSILKLEKLITEYKKSKPLSSNLKNNKTKTSKTNKNISDKNNTKKRKTQKKKQ